MKKAFRRFLGTVLLFLLGQLLFRAVGSWRHLPQKARSLFDEYPYNGSDPARTPLPFSDITPRWDGMGWRRLSFWGPVSTLCWGGQ